MGQMTGGISKLIAVLVFVLVAFALLPAILTSVSDTAALAILGSFSGGSALILIVGTIVIAGLILWIVNFFFPGAVGGAVARVTRRR
jgi:hypothetical protein